MKNSIIFSLLILSCTSLKGQILIDTFVVTDNYKLPAIITLPNNLQSSTKNIPAVVLLAGSGLADKDGSYRMPNKTMKNISEGLAKEGIASIRFDKRTLVYREEFIKNIEKGSIEQEYNEDAKSAIELIRSVKEIDKNNIWILGHSLGAVLAPSIAYQNSKSVRGIIMMAGTIRKYEDLILEQYEYIYSLDTTQKELKGELENIRKKINNVKNITHHSTFSISELPLYLPQSYWISLSKNSPDIFLPKLNKPILVLQGERDFKVTMKDFLQIKSFLGNKAYYISYPHLNHIFLEGKAKKSVPLEEFIPSQIPDYVFKDISQFIFLSKKW